MDPNDGHRRTTPFDLCRRTAEEFAKLAFDATLAVLVPKISQDGCLESARPSRDTHPRPGGWNDSGSATIAEDNAIMHLWTLSEAKGIGAQLKGMAHAGPLETPNLCGDRDRAR